MVQGTTSDAGKSTLVAGLARLLWRRGVRVAPFKPQNMALNSAVTVDGGEIGRAQALQAIAAGLEPHTDMNPVLLKPSTDIGAQVIIHGRAVANLSARDYHNYKPRAMAAVMESYGRLADAYDAVLVEGAGSPAEINLRDRDIANMGFAEVADVPGDPGRRHRPWRRLRPPGRHPGAAVPLRAGARQGLRDQPLPRRPRLLAIGPRLARGAHWPPGVGRAALPARALPRRRGRPRRQRRACARAKPRCA
jgi:hypothetical protein